MIDDHFEDLAQATCVRAQRSCLHQGLRGPTRGVYCELFVIIDVFSRYVIDCIATPAETGELAKEFIDTAITGQGIDPGCSAQNLAAAFFDYEPEILAFTRNLEVSFDNNQAERDLRMAKIAQKISYGWRTSDGVTAFAHTRSYIETGRKHHHHALDLLTQLFTTGPWTIPT